MSEKELDNLFLMLASDDTDTKQLAYQMLRNEYNLNLEYCIGPNGVIYVCRTYYSNSNYDHYSTLGTLLELVEKIMFNKYGMEASAYMLKDILLNCPNVRKGNK